MEEINALDYNRIPSYIYSANVLIRFSGDNDECINIRKEDIITYSVVTSEKKYISITVCPIYEYTKILTKLTSGNIESISFCQYNDFGMKNIIKAKDVTFNTIDFTHGAIILNFSTYSKILFSEENLMICKICGNHLSEGNGFSPIISGDSVCEICKTITNKGENNA
jgi:hypothetical protein